MDANNSTKEHVIGRRFVPAGKLDGEWNLIVRACAPCNREKADLEDDISAITMQPDAWGQPAVADPDLTAGAQRKAQGSKSRRTKKSVEESSERLSVDLPLGPGIQMTLGLTSPPQPDNDRLFRLSLFHSRAFFYWITYNETSRKGGFWPGSFFPVLFAMRPDWGNPIHRSFMDAVFEWELKVLGTGAGGFFKVAIRCHPTTTCWSWAYEWNQNLRVIGFFGEEAPAQAIVNAFPSLGWVMIPQSGRYRRETHLLVEDDKLFS